MRLDPFLPFLRDLLRQGFFSALSILISSELQDSDEAGSRSSVV
jgi:hypothetical protein